MKQIKTYSMEGDVILWLQTKKNQSEVLNGLCHAEMQKEGKREGKMRACINCGAMYSEVLEKCPSRACRKARGEL